MRRDRIRRLLDQERELLLEVLRSGQEGLDISSAGGAAELSSADQHPADMGTETFEREKSQAIVDSAEARLRDIEDAFHRLETGTYGRCETCDQPIGDERLEARPAARYCLEHQQEMERRLSPTGGASELAPPA